jgi:hypothetical protein
MATRSRQLLAYRFGWDSRFEGQLVGALERIESGGAMRVLDALFVARDPESGELAAVSLTAEGSAGIIGRLLDFRLQPEGRANSTRRALEGPTGAAVRELGEMLEPGHAIAAVLVEHAWADTLDDAVSRIGGTQTASEMVQAGTLREITDHLRRAARTS